MSSAPVSRGPRRRSPCTFRRPRASPCRCRERRRDQALDEPNARLVQFPDFDLDRSGPCRRTPGRACGPPVRKRIKPVARRRAGVSLTLAGRSASWPLSGRPDMWAPQTASLTDFPRAAGRAAAACSVNVRGARASAVRARCRSRRPTSSRIAKRRRDQRHAERQAVVREARRHGDRREVEQIHEIGVGAEIAC